MRAWQAFVVLALASRAAWATSHHVDTRPGCLMKNYKFDPPVDSQKDAKKADTLGDCHHLCLEDPECKFFTFWNDQDKPYSCWLEKRDATPKYEEKAVSGRRECKPEPIACTEPGPENWPGGYLTAETSNTAWKGGFQPVPLQCWPLDANEKPETCKFTEPTVLEDVANTDGDWKGACEFLKKDLKSNDSQDKCKAQCYEDPLCAAWQWTKKNECWHGVGVHCNLRENMEKIEVVAAQRIQHGTVRDLMTFAGYSLPAKTQVNGFGLAKWPDLTDADLEAAATECKKLCQSYIKCTWWQLNKDKKTGGCFFEDPDAPVEQGLTAIPYPLTAQAMTEDANIFKGGLIQHTCLKPTPVVTEKPASTTTILAEAPKKKEDDSLPWWAYALIILAALIVIGAIAYAIMASSKSAPKKKRSLKKKIVEPAAAPLVEPQPVELVQATVTPLPTYQQVVPMQIQALQPTVVAQPVQSTVVAQPVQYQQSVQYQQAAPMYQQAYTTPAPVQYTQSIQQAPYTATPYM